MNLPTSFRLKGHTWTVEYVPNKIQFDGLACRGLCYPERRIQIWKRQSKQKLLETFLHEYMHAVGMSWGVRIPHPAIYALEGPLAAIMARMMKVGKG